MRTVYTTGPRTGLLLVEQAVRVDVVVRVVDEHVVLVHLERRALGHVSREGFHLVAGEDRDGLAVLRADHQRLGGAVPQVAVGLVEVVHHGAAGIVVGETDLSRRAGHLSDALLGDDQGGTDVVDDRFAERDLHHRRIGVAGALAVGAVERGVAGDVEGLALHFIDQRAIGVVGGHGGFHAVEGAGDISAELRGAAASGEHSHQSDRQDAEDAQTLLGHWIFSILV